MPTAIVLNHPDRPNLPALYDAVCSGWREGGFSLYIDGTAPYFYTDEWVVSIIGTERVFSAPPAMLELYSFVSAHLTLLSDPRNFLGGWVEQGTFVLDVSTSSPNRACAHHFAQLQRQRAIYHPFTGTTELVHRVCFPEVAG